MTAVTLDQKGPRVSRTGKVSRYSNRSIVRDIERKLSFARYVTLPARSHEQPFNFPGEDLERLSEDEHERWMLQKLKDGARYGVPRHDPSGIHDSLLPWHPTSRAALERKYGTELASRIGDVVLTDEDKDRDRNLIRNIPRILAKAGYTVVKLTDDSESG